MLESLKKTTKCSSNDVIKIVDYWINNNKIENLANDDASQLGMLYVNTIRIAQGK